MSQPGKRPLGLGLGLPLPEPSKKKAKTSNNSKPWITDQFTVPSASGKDGKGDCKHCRQPMSMANSTVLKQHLFNTNKCTFLASNTASELSKTVDELKAARINAGHAPASTTSRPSSIAQGSSTASGSKLLQSLRADVVTEADQDMLQRAFARMIYDTNLPHSWPEHPTVKWFFAMIKPAFILPSRYRISGPLLKDAYNTVATQVQDLMKSTKFVTLTTDGWSRTQGSTHVLNFMTCAPGFSIFLESVAADAERVDAEFIKTAAMDVISKHGFDYAGKAEVTKDKPKVVAMVTDTPNVMKSAWKLMTREISNLICFGCFCHVLDLFLKDVGTKVEPVKSVLDQAQAVVKHFKRNTIPSDLLHQEQLRLKVNVALAMIIVTRFATHVRTLNSLLSNQHALKAVVATAKYEKHSGKSSEVAVTINNPQFWEDAKALTQLLEPVAKHIITLQSNSAYLSDAYFAVLEIDQHLSAAAVDETYLTTSFSDSLADIQDLWESRREYGWHAALPAAALLDQRYRARAATMPQDHRQQGEKLIMDRGGQAALVQLNHLRHKPVKIGIDPATALDPKVCPTVDPLDWWADNKEKCAALANVAFQLLSIPPTASGGERNWSTWSNIWSDNRSCLLLGRVAMLVYVHYNTRMLQAMTEAVPDLDFERFLEDLSELPVENSEGETEIEEQTETEAEGDS